MPAYPAHVFREYDIRGIADRDLSDAFARDLARAFAGTIAPSKRPVIVGRDARLSGPRLHQAVCHGLMDAGLEVWDIDMVPTPLGYFAVYHWQAAGLIMVTGSHNPRDYNGFKIMRGLDSLHGDDIQAMKIAMMHAPPGADTKGAVRKKDVMTPYRRFLQDDVVLERPLKVVIDAGNGPAGVIAAPVYRALGCHVTELFCEPDGRFPNHHPDPTIEANMADVQRAVLEQQADIGIAFDGDGDRIGVVDETGRIVWGDMLLLLLARQVLAQYPGATIISEVKCSQRLYEDIEAHGGRGIMWRTGHSPIKAKMRETGAKLAGEMSGHIFFADRYFGFDDAIYAGARLLQLLAAANRPLSRCLADVPAAVATPEIRVDCPDTRKFDIVEEAKRHFAEQGYDIIDVDGMRLRFPDGWALLRASNTQPALVLRFEAPCEERLQSMRAMIEGWLATHI